MSEFKKKVNEIHKNIDNVTGFAETATEIFFSPVEDGDVQNAKEGMKLCKKCCRAIGVIVLVICVAIIFFHLKG